MIVKKNHKIKQPGAKLFAYFHYKLALCILWHTQDNSHPRCRSDSPDNFEDMVKNNSLHNIPESHILQDTHTHIYIYIYTFVLLECSQRAFSFWISKVWYIFCYNSSSRVSIFFSEFIFPVKVQIFSLLSIFQVLEHMLKFKSWLCCSRHFGSRLYFWVSFKFKIPSTDLKHFNKLYLNSFIRYFRTFVIQVNYILFKLRSTYHIIVIVNAATKLFI